MVVLHIRNRILGIQSTGHLGNKSNLNAYQILSSIHVHMRVDTISTQYLPNTAAAPLPGDVTWRILLASKYLEPSASVAFGMLRLFLVH